MACKYRLGLIILKFMKRGLFQYTGITTMTEEVGEICSQVINKGRPSTVQLSGSREGKGNVTMR